MDLSAAITIQRPGKAPLDINSIRDPNAVGSAPLSGYSVETVDFSMVNVSAFTEDTPLVDGIDSYDAYLGGRQVNMVVAVYGSTYGDFWDKITALNEALQAQPKAADTGTYPALPADGMRKMSFTQQSDANADYSLYMNVRPMMMPRFETEKSTAAGVAEKGYAALAQVSLMAEDPYKYFATESTFTRTGSGTISVVNRGTTVAWPTVTWANTASATISATLGSDTVSHSAVSTTVTDTFKTSMSTNPTTLTGYEFFSIPPGTSAVSVTAEASATVTITIREAIL
jgi:hypothetical protein